MSSTEEYLDSLLKAAMESDQKNTTDSLESDMVSDFTNNIINAANGSDVDSEREMTHEEFVAMLASVDDEIEEEMADDFDFYAEPASDNDEINDVDMSDINQPDTDMFSESMPDVDTDTYTDADTDIYEESISNVEMFDGELSDIDVTNDSLTDTDTFGNSLDDFEMSDESLSNADMYEGSIPETDVIDIGLTEEVSGYAEQEDDVDQLLESMAMEDEELAEINDLLKKSDSDEFPEDDMLAMLEEASEKNNETKDDSIVSTIENEELFDFFGDMEAEEEPTELEKQLDDSSQSEELPEAEKSKKEKSKKEKSKKSKGEKKKFSFFKNKKKNQAEGNEQDELSGMVQSEQNESLNEITDEETNDMFGQIDEGGITGLSDLLDLDGQMEGGESDLFMGEDAVFLQGDIPEIDVDGSNSDKKKGFFARMFDLLTEEVEDEIEEKPKKEKKKKGKKDKDEKKKSENEEIVDELESEDAQDGKKGKKKKKKEKPKKEKKKPEPASDFMDNKLPRKMVIRIFVLCFSILALIILISNALSSITSLNEARKAYYNKNYQLTYENMIGKKLNESDSLILEKATIILKLQRKYDSYINYSSMGMHEHALNALLSGYKMYNETYEEAVSHNITNDYDMIKKLIVDALQNTYGISEQRAQELNAIEDISEYQSALEQEILNQMSN